MKILILGGTGAMGTHVSQFLAQSGYDVIVTSRRARVSDIPGVSYVKGNAKEIGFLDELLADHWDAIIDFMIWSTDEFKVRVAKFLSVTNQYVFTSSYRVYADSPIITEDSSRLLDVIENPEYLATDEYALAKARCENMLFDSSRSNWTIVRPAVTYDGTGRFQLTVHEADTWLWRALRGIPVPVPQFMLTKQATMSWGGDVARMIALLIGNSKAMGEAFTVSTAEHMTWEQIVGIYQTVVPTLNVRDCDMAGFERAHGAVWQIRYDRMYDRVVDNTKVLNATELRQSQLVTFRDGLTSQLRQYLDSGGQPRLNGIGRQARFDRLIGGAPTLKYAADKGLATLTKYLIRRYIK